MLNKKFLIYGFMVLGVLLCVPSYAYADCTNPAGTEGQQIYNADHSTMQFCDGTNWIAMTGGAGADNLGNHTATADLDMGTNSITNVGNVSASGVVIVGTQAGCAAGDAGAIRYVGGAVPYEYCDGGGTWSPFKQPACGDDDTAGCYIDTTRDASDPDFIAANIVSGVNILGVTGTATGGGGDGPLFNGDHLESECLAAGGQVVVIGADTVCDFAASACPGGWTAYGGGMTKTTAKFCAGDHTNCDCTTGFHTAWTATVETCVYYTRASRGVCNTSATYTATCSANISNVACY